MMQIILYRNFQCIFLATIKCLTLQALFPELVFINSLMLRTILHTQLTTKF